METNFKSLIATIKARNLINGTLLVAHKEDIICAETFGVAELTTGRPLTIATRFNLASVSKPITAIAILLLAQQGKLNLEDTINKWIQVPYDGISIKNLLNHTAGLPDYMALFEQYWDQTQVAQNSDVLDLFWQYQPAIRFKPGERLEYSNTGYIFLALIIEAVSASYFADFLQKELFTPLQMQHTSSYNIHLMRDLPIDFALGYVPDVLRGSYCLPTELTETMVAYYLDGMQGDGSVISTVHDLYKFERALNTTSFINPELLKEAYTKATPLIPSDFNYGYGWIIEEDAQYGKTVFHTGGWPGYSTLLKRYVDHDFVVIILRNMETDFATENAVEKAIENVLFGKPYVLPIEKPPISHAIYIPESRLVSLCGTYQTEREDGMTTLFHTQFL